MSDFSEETYETIRARTEATVRQWMLEVGKTVDLRRDSSILSPWMDVVAVEARQVRIGAGDLENQMFPDTASLRFLKRHAADRGLRPPFYEATHAWRRLICTPATIDLMAIVPTPRFRYLNQTYVLLGPITPPAGSSPQPGHYLVECEQPGIQGNQFFGPARPIVAIDGLERAELADVEIPARDDETRDELWERYKDSLIYDPFGGNISDYRQRTNALPGVGGCKIYPAFANGWTYEQVRLPNSPITGQRPINSAEVDTLIATIPGYAQQYDEWVLRVREMDLQGVLSVGGGLVEVRIIDSNFAAPEPSGLLIENVQNALDPSPQGTGVGLAPIGHAVTVLSAINRVVNIHINAVDLTDGFTWQQVEPDAAAAINAYFLELATEWDKVDWVRNGPQDTLTVRVTTIVTRLLLVQGIRDVDYINLLLNGVAGNLVLDRNEIPVLGGLSVG